MFKVRKWDHFRQPGSRGHGCDGRPMALRPRLLPGLPLSNDGGIEAAWIKPGRRMLQYCNDVYDGTAMSAMRVRYLRRPGSHSHLRD